MNIGQLKGKKVAILGIGMEGIALADFVVNYTSDITLLDKLSEGELEQKVCEMRDEKLGRILSDNRFKKSFGSEYLDNLTDFEIIFRSPGVPYLEPKIREVKVNGIEISSQIKLFFDLCPCPIIGVTGTKGKGTTSTLIQLMLKKFQETRDNNQTNSKSEISNSNQITNSLINQSTNIYLAGNIGEPAITLIDKLSKDDTVILELSSFQLQDMEKSPHIAVVLNISIDHLDYHKDEAEYKKSKVNIVEYQSKDDYAIVNQDYLTSFEFASQTDAQVYYFSTKDSVDQGAFVRKSQITNHKSQINSKSQKLNKQEIYEAVLRIDEKEEIICQSDEIQLIGKHNLENIAAASIAAKLAGADIESIKSVAKEFKGLTHRLEFIKEIRGVKYYNDSFATNPGPTMAAINSFDQPTHLILGGSSKGADFSEMAQMINKSNIASVSLIGVEAEKIKKALDESGYDGALSNLSGDINNIVSEVSKKSKLGDVVLFSPACASFDMFKNYKDRGEKFKKAVLSMGNS